MIKVGITHGDINGIGYEVIMDALADDRICELCTPVLFGSAKLVSYYKKTLGTDGFRYTQIPDASSARDGCVNLVNITDGELKVDIGKPTAESGRAAMLSLDMAITALRNGDIDVLVTAPVNKHAITDKRFHPGHTEFLERELGDADHKAMMILFGEDIRVALVTTHMALKDVPGALTPELIEDKIRRLDAILRRDFACTRPRIAVLGLNPHCGDNGLSGTEEQTCIAPAIEAVGKDGIMAFGPLAADGVFGTGAYRRYDAVLAMYHDQGLAPLKLATENRGVNFTAGLPYIRTSPDHGTGYDIAGRGKASGASMREAIFGAIDIYRRRMDYDNASANPLKKYHVERPERNEFHAKGIKPGRENSPENTNTDDINIDNTPCTTE